MREHADSTALVELASEIFHAASGLGQAFKTDALNHRERQVMPNWQTHAGAFEAFVKLIERVRQHDRQQPAGFAAVWTCLNSAAATAKEVRQRARKERHFIDYTDYAADFFTIAKTGSEALETFRKLQPIDDPLDLEGPRRERELGRPFTRTDEYPTTPAGSLRFIEWVCREIKEQATAAAQARFPPPSIQKQLQDGVYRDEARSRLVAHFSCLPQMVVEQVRLVLERELTVDTVEQVAELLVPAVRLLRDAWEKHRAATGSETILLTQGTKPPDAPDPRLAPYFAEIRAVEDRWLAEEEGAWQTDNRGRNSGTSPWLHHRALLAGIDRRHGIGPEDPRVYSITAYLTEQRRLTDDWADLCRRHSWHDQDSLSNEAKHAAWLASCRHYARLADLDARHFGDLIRPVEELNSPRQLWAHITKCVLPMLESIRRNPRQLAVRPNEGDKFDVAVERVLAALHLLKVEWAEVPSYQPLSVQESIDKMRAIANRLEREDARTAQSPLARAQEIAQRAHLAKREAAEHERVSTARQDYLNSKWCKVHIFRPTVHEEQGIDYFRWSENLWSFCQAVLEADASSRFLSGQPCGDQEAIALSLVQAGITGGKLAIDERLAELAESGDLRWMDVFNDEVLFWRIMQPWRFAVATQGAKSKPEPDPVDPPTAPDGPQAPNFFLWRGKKLEINPKPWQVLSYLWDRPNRSADLYDLCVAIWDDEEAVGSAFRSARYKLNKCFINGGVPLELSVIGRFAALRPLKADEQD